MIGKATKELKDSHLRLVVRNSTQEIQLYYTFVSTLPIEGLVRHDGANQVLVKSTNQKPLWCMMKYRQAFVSCSL